MKLSPASISFCNTPKVKFFDKNDEKILRDMAQNGWEDNEILNTNYIFDFDCKSIYTGRFLKAYYMYEMQIHPNKN
ncbi:hypothetical protein IJ531_06330 [bacterium]|nr:hypothetical protein [bacterium]